MQNEIEDYTLPFRIEELNLQWNVTVPRMGLWVMVVLLDLVSWYLNS